MEELNNFESQLGKVEYWDNFYEEEIEQFNENSDLIGEIWFGTKTQKKVVTYINENFSDKNIKILDVGCGNSAFILKLSKNGFINLWGMDYSEKSILLSQEIIRNKINEDKITTINLYQEDIKSPTKNNGEYGIIHDKGTFDAFMSSKENTIDEYIHFIKINSVRNLTNFILTSCNYCFSELEKFFIEGNNFKLIGNIPHQSFSYGGSTGQVVTTIILLVI